ncbi:MAG TPA: LacI family transcriptional regulator [Anaerolineae bacterium]|nr:LacI family transcriptional regulator [Anaerolineae bacterium]
MVVTLKDIANRIGKSVTTVSRALHDYNDVSPETKELVHQVAEEMGYSPNTLAQRLQKRQSDTIGLILPTFGPRFSDPFFSELLAGIGNKAVSLGYDLLVSTSSPGERELQIYKKMVNGRRVDGFIVVRTRKEDRRVEYLLEKDFPFVAFGRVGINNEFPYVDEDGAYGMRSIAKHLVTLGFTNIGCIAPDPQLTFASSRVDGLRAGLTDHGITLDEDYVCIGDLTQSGGYKQANCLLDKLHPPSAIVACNDLMAFGAMSAIQDRGLIVGEDVAVTGFDDIPMAEHTHPPLTTVHQPVYQIGGMVCEMLIKRIQGVPMDDEHLVLKPSLIVRKSCGEK